MPLKRYDRNGIRQEKTVSEVTHSYYADGSRIIAENVSGGSASGMREYYYDAHGITGMRYNNADYYFSKNLQGDVERILNAQGNIVAYYRYDAWGNHRVYLSSGLDITENGSYNSIYLFRFIR